MTDRVKKPCHLSAGALASPSLPPQLRSLGRRVARDGGAFVAPVVVAFASELIAPKPRLPEWSRGATTRFLIVVDVPDAVLPRVFSALDLRRPDQRVHVTRDEGAIRRLLVSTVRADPMLGIVDAYLWHGALTLVTGDMEFRSFPVGLVPSISGLPAEEQRRFTIGADGSRLHWEHGDIDLGVSQVLQDADPMYMTDIAIERNAADLTGAALRRLREEKGLRQSDVDGLSERQVRRIEDGTSRLRVATAETFAAAFGMELRALLDSIARYAGEMRDGGRGDANGADADRRHSRGVRR